MIEAPFAGARCHLLYFRFRRRYSSSLPVLWAVVMAAEEGIAEGLKASLGLSFGFVALQQPVAATLEPVDVEVIRYSFSGTSSLVLAPRSTLPSSMGITTALGSTPYGGRTASSPVLRDLRRSCLLLPIAGGVFA